MRKISDDNKASAVPLIYFILTIVVVGALFTLFFIEVFFPLLDVIPIDDSPYKTAILFVLRGICIIVLIVGSIALLLSGLKERWMVQR